MKKIYNIHANVCGNVAANVCGSTSAILEKLSLRSKAQRVAGRGAVAFGGIISRRASEGQKNTG
ncbi:MAG: hypothetical protein AVDCRST_MAG95-185 [uncultured Adhaeribacter sp.]|uniref:Uncharacterized protein n=1 Tax=uncultured Adhaeribacter sp. TaxID=448109 RepID=A0A6J4H6D5_9BACT|nr:MAG: hypothetical protein AVDCRST_MAG95-185 [uncultured Adhaeribacter sp.]